MSIELILIIVGAFLLLLVVVFVLHKRIPRKLKTDKFQVKWQELQGLCRDKQTWPSAIIEADKLLDAALKRRRFRGKSMGERLVAAQRSFSDNDELWFAHNLRKKIIADAEFKLRETDVKDALMGFRQALRDLGALPPNGEVANDK
jgi:hypothetical protein